MNLTELLQLYGLHIYMVSFKGLQLVITVLNNTSVTQMQQHLCLRNGKKHQQISLMLFTFVYVTALRAIPKLSQQFAAAV